MHCHSHCRCYCCLHCLHCNLLDVSALARRSDCRRRYSTAVSALARCSDCRCSLFAIYCHECICFACRCSCYCRLMHCYCCCVASCRSLPNSNCAILVTDHDLAYASTHLELQSASHATSNRLSSDSETSTALALCRSSWNSETSTALALYR